MMGEHDQMAASNALVNLGGLTKPAVVLIEKISDAVGGIYKPYQMVRVAKADAEIARIQAETRIEVSDLERRAVFRWMKEEAKRQSNIESITEQALPQLKEDASPGNVSDDWITNFFDKARIVSETEMQQLWSKLLAGEANKPGAVSRQTVNLLGNMDQRDAELFTRLCRFLWWIGDLRALVFDFHDDIYVRNGLDFKTLLHLESLGLVQINHLTSYSISGLGPKIRTQYGNYVVDVMLPNSETLQIGKVVLTRPGRELAIACNWQPDDEFYNYVLGRWVQMGLVAPDQVKASEEAANEADVQLTSV